MKKQYIKPTVNVMDLKYEAALCMTSTEQGSSSAHDTEGEIEDL